MKALERAISICDTWLDEGRPVSAETLIARHPDLSDLLSALLCDREAIERAVRDELAGARTIGGYRIVDELGRGGMGVVYRARQLSLDRMVALKVLPPQLGGHASALARFRREANLAARLVHPNIVAIHEVGTTDDTHWFAMELIDGTPLARVDPVTGKPRSVRQCVELCLQLCDALHYAHGCGVLHRDVKPLNILVRRDGTPVLTDFGLARCLEEPGLTQTGTFAGTVYYAAPEQVRGEPDLDARVDVYALGATLYELLTGRRPFEGSSVPEVLDRLARTEAADPVRIVPDLAPDLAAIVLKAVDKDRARRYASAAAFGDDLRAFLEFRPITARRATPWSRFQRWARREPLRAAAAVMVALAIPIVSLAIGFWLANRGVLEVGAAELSRRDYEERLTDLVISLEAGSYVDALAAAQRVIPLRPGDVEAHVLYAIARAWSGIAKADEAALAGLEQAIERHHLPEAERARIAVLSAIGRFEEARRREAALPPPTSPEALYLAALAASDRGQRETMDPEKWRHVRDLLLRAMLVAPAPRLHYYLKWANAIGWIGERAAIDQCNEVLLQLWPDSPAARLYVAFSLRQSNPARAIELYEQVLAAGYDHPRIHATIARCYAALDKKDLSRAAAETGIAGYLRREADGLLSEQERLNLILELEWANRGDEALRRAREAVARRPDDARAHNTLGWLLDTRKDLPGAAAALVEAVRLNPNDARVLDRLAGVYEKLGDRARAAETYRSMVALQPQSARAHGRLGQQLAALGDREGADAAFARALSLTNDPAMRAELERLRTKLR